MYSKELDHMGLVAGMFDYLEIGQTIDQLIIQSERSRNLSLGEIVKGMVLNALGHTERTLYLMPEYFKDKCMESLFAEGVEAAHFNDSVLGRALDALQAYGTTNLYGQVATHAAKRLHLSSKYAHMDSTSFHVDGQYNSAQEAPQENIIHVTQGYSRDMRPDLNQLVLNMIVDNASGIPLHMEALDGNSVDVQTFRNTIRDHVNQLQNVHSFEYLVMDSSGYTEATLQLCASKELKWISRVPERIKACKEVISKSQLGKAPSHTDALRYEWHEGVEYGGVPQRWLLVFSPQAYSREHKTYNKNYLKKSQQSCKAYTKLTKQKFACEHDAQKALKAFEDQYPGVLLSEAHINSKAIYKTKGRPKKTEEPMGYEYFITANMASKLEHYEEGLQTKGMFILATNDTDGNKLNAQELIKAYKGQSSVERGFRFLKDPQFVARNFYVKKPQRLEALVLIMTISLTVYAAIQHMIRTALVAQALYLPNQLKKPSQTPTARWLFYLLKNTSAVYVNNEIHILNLNETKLKILKLLPPHFHKYYFIE